METLFKQLWMDIRRLGSAFLLVAAVSANALAQTGQVQWVHASADTALAVVDVYLDGELIIDDFGYQTATPFEASIPGSHQIVIAPENSSGIADSIATFSANIADDNDYHLIIGGVGDPEAFRRNPDGRSTALDLFVVDGARQASVSPGAFTTRQFCGVIDLGAVTFRSETFILFQNVRYGETTDYVTGDPGAYVGRMGATGRASGNLHRVEGDFVDDADKSMLSVVSGFFATPSGLGFDWFNVYPDGTVEHPKNLTEYNRVQIVHGAPDPDIEQIDVYFDGNLLLDDFEYKTGTAFMDLPGGFHDLDIAPALSLSDDEKLMHLRPFLVSGDTSNAVLAGVLEPDEFLPNPDGRSTELKLHLLPGALQESDDPGNVAVRQFYGVPNLPAVTLTTEGILVAQNTRYGEVTDYTYPEPREYEGSIRATGIGTGSLYRMVGPFSGLADQAVFGVLTGFFGSGDGIENFLVTPAGTVITGSETTPTMRAQFVHASADPALESLDLYLDGIPLLADHDFADASPFMDLPSGTHEFAVAASGSAGKNEAVETYRVMYQKNTTYSMVLAGVVEPDLFASNPEGKDTSLELFITDDALEAPLDPSDFSVRQFYGVINMPKSNFWVREWGSTLFQQVSYGDFTTYETSGDNLGLLHGEVREVRTSLSKPPLIAAGKSWSEERGNAVLEVITGYLYDDHPGGHTADVRWLHVRADGSVTPQEITGTWTSTEDDVEIPSSFAVAGNYPNPFNPSTQVAFELPHPAEVSVEVYDVAGRHIFTSDPVNMPAGQRQSVRIDATAWSSGLYFYKVIARTGTSSWIGTGQMILLK